jgi:hypothetical protein
MIPPYDFTNSTWLVVIIIIAIWELIWKGIAMWKAGRNNQLPWFVAILIVNSIGILPILYIAFFQKKTNRTEVSKSVKKKKR